MAINKAQQGLSPEDVTSLCDTAKEAWDNTSSSARKVLFTWRNKRYQSRLSNFRMLVETLQGKPVAGRYH
jgi:hypothetical protein